MSMNIKLYTLTSTVKNRSDITEKKKNTKL